MKKAKWASLVILLPLIFGCGHLWGKHLMNATNTKVENEHFFDNNNRITFQLPEKSYVYGSYTEGADLTSRHVRLEIKGHKLPFDIYWKKIGAGGKREEIIKSEIERIVGWYPSSFKIMGSGFGKNFRINQREIIHDTNLGPQGVLQVSYKEGYLFFPNRTRIEYQKIIVKDDFLLRCEYDDYEKTYQAEAADKVTQDVLLSFHGK